MKKYFYERNPFPESELNITFDEILSMSDKELRDWIIKVRQYFLDVWNNEGSPPITSGMNEKQILESFNKLQTFITDNFLVKDEADNTLTVIRNWNKFATPVNQFFPAMMKTRISVGGKADNAMSIYDWFERDDKKDEFIRIVKRKIRFDTMYSFGRHLLVADDDYAFNTTDETVEWVRRYKENRDFQRQYGFWIHETNKDQEDKTSRKYMLLTPDEIRDMNSRGWLVAENVANISLDNLSEKYKSGKPKYYAINVFRRGQKVVGELIQIFRLGFSLQPAVNFPPLTAKFLYEYFTRHITDEKITIYDPSAGWGGRVLGALSLDKKTVHYVGTDPNTENFIEELGITRYEYLARYFNKNVAGAKNKFWGHKNSYKIFMEGSEHIHKNPEFQKYKGQLDFVFTSPPYFNREQYSEDETQSFKAYPAYEDWRDNFLRPTLTTAYEYLKNDRYICWNIADIKIGKDKYIPLEQDSINILTELGAKYKGKFKMLMATMIGIDVEKTVKNKCKVGGRWQKFEPIFIFYKP